MPENNEMKEALLNALRSYFQIGDSYVYNLTRDKHAFVCGTMGFDDFEEFSEENIEDLANYLMSQGVVKAPGMVNWEERQLQRWIYAYCPVCDTIHNVKSNYCSNCGTYMKNANYVYPKEANRVNNS